MTDQKVPDYSAFKERGPGDNILAQIAGTAQRYLDAKAKVAQLEAELSTATADFRRIEQVELPELMEAARQKKVVTEEGIEVSVRDVLRASIPEAHKDEAFKWLDDSGNSGLIKREFVISFNKEEESWANKFERDLKQRKKQLNVARKKSVNPQTLSAFLRGLAENGVDFPHATFGVIQQKQAAVKVVE